MASEGGEYQYFGAEITDYACLGDTSIYKEHVFNVRAWVDQRMYSVQRSYESFCELDAQLRRKVMYCLSFMSVSLHVISFFLHSTHDQPFHQYLSLDQRSL